MAEKDKILRARDIIPSRPNAPAIGEDESISDIPQFNLADDIMAWQRRLIAIRRKGPGVNASENVVAVESSVGVIESSSYASQWDPIIADIVARDIERLCKL
jgi:hypothetical protein